jgi:hypothetical protein
MNVPVRYIAGQEVMWLDSSNPEHAELISQVKQQAVPMIDKKVSVEIHAVASR